MGTIQKKIKDCLIKYIQNLFEPVIMYLEILKIILAATFISDKSFINSGVSKNYEIVIVLPVGKSNF